MPTYSSNLAISRLLTTWLLAVLSLATDLKFSGIGSGGAVEVMAAVALMSLSMLVEVVVVDLMILVPVAKYRTANGVFKL